MRKLMLLQLLPRGLWIHLHKPGREKKKTPTTDCSPTNCSHLLLAASDTIVQAILKPISKTQEEQEQEQENQRVAEGENTRVVEMQWTSSLIILVMTLIRVFVSLLQLVSFFGSGLLQKKKKGRDIVMMADSKE